ncbi:MAG: ABC transporter permease [bacterium]
MTPGLGTGTPLGYSDTNLPQPDGTTRVTTDKARTLRADALRRLRKNKLAIAGLVWIIIVILIAITADLWAPRWLGDPVKIDSATAAQQRLLPPSLEHPFGTDKLGRDVASRVVYGARVSLIVGILAVAIMVAIGLLLGALAAYYGGIWDSIMHEYILNCMISN